MIYTGKRIVKHRDHYVEVDSIEYIKDIDLPETIDKVAFLLSDVTMWNIHKDLVSPFRYKESLLEVKFKYSPNIIIVETYDAFTHLIHDYDANRFIQFREQ